MFHNVRIPNIRNPFKNKKDEPDPYVTKVKTIIRNEQNNGNEYAHNDVPASIYHKLTFNEDQNRFIENLLNGLGYTKENRSVLAGNSGGVETMNEGDYLLEDIKTFHNNRMNIKKNGGGKSRRRRRRTRGRRKSKKSRKTRRRGKK